MPCTSAAIRLTFSLSPVSECSVHGSDTAAGQLRGTEIQILIVIEIVATICIFFQCGFSSFRSPWFACFVPGSVIGKWSHAKEQSLQLQRLFHGTNLKLKSSGGGRKLSAYRVGCFSFFKENVFFFLLIKHREDFESRAVQTAAFVGIRCCAFKPLPVPKISQNITFLWEGS